MCGMKRSFGYSIAQTTTRHEGTSKAPRLLWIVPDIESAAHHKKHRNDWILWIHTCSPLQIGDTNQYLQTITVQLNSIVTSTKGKGEAKELIGKLLEEELD
jgi:hypothetical protein